MTDGIDGAGSRTGGGLMDPDSLATRVHMYSGSLIHAALDLGVPDQVGDGGIAVIELAERVQADSASLRRLLGVLSTIGIFQVYENDTVAHTPGSTVLRSQAATGYVMDAFAGNAAMAQMWDHLPAAVRSGDAASPRPAASPSTTTSTRTPRSCRQRSTPR